MYLAVFHTSLEVMTRCTKLIWTKLFCWKGKTTGLDHCCKVTALQNLGWVHNMFLKLDAAALQNNGACHKTRIISYLSQSSLWFGIFLLRDILVQWLFSFLRLNPADIQSLLGHCVIQSSLHIYTLVLSCVLYLSEHQLKFFIQSVNEMWRLSLNYTLQHYSNHRTWVTSAN